MTPMPMTLMTDDEVAMYGRASRRDDNDACFGALRTERGLLPLAAMDVDVRVTGVVASIDVAQTFVNTTGTVIEATYIFPLPDRAAVHRFQMQIADRVIEGVIDERGAARENYDQAIAAGHRAAITEEERPGVFTMRVGNLMPGDSATVRLSLVGPLPVDDGEITLRFPLVVAPRYMPGHGLPGEQAGLGIATDTNLVPDASRISPPVLLAGCPNPVRLGLRVAISDPDLGDIASSLHAVTIKNNDAKVIEVRPGERLDRDFILRWRLTAGTEMTSSLVCADDADGKAGTFLLTIVPPATTAVAAKPRDVIFVIDRSGSMQGWKMVAARRAAARMIDTLTGRDRFCAMAFDTSVDELPEPGLVAATDRNRYRAVEALGKVDARGGTEMFEPLRRALSLLAGGTDDRERVVVLVTDGQVGNEDQLLRELAPHVKNVRMFTLGIDQAVNAAFLKRLAGVGGGLCELVESEDRLDVVMAKVHRRIGMPIATELALFGSSIDLDGSSFAPKKLPDVYAGSPVTIFGRYRGAAASNAAIEVTGTSLGDPLKMSIASMRTPGTWIAASWARAHIRDLEDQYAANSSSTIEQQIVTTSKRFSVLSRFTAFLAVDRSEVVNKGGLLHQVVQPVEPAAGWAQNAAPPPPPAQVMHSNMVMRSPRPTASAPSAPPPMSPAPMMSPPMASPRGGMAGGAGSAGPLGGPPAMPGGARPSADMGAGMPPPQNGPARPAPQPPMSRAMAPAKKAESAKDQARGRRMEPMPKGGAPSAEESIASVAAAPSAATPAAYLAKLATLAKELEAQAHGRNDAASIRVLRQRLTEWVEDVRSVAGDSSDTTAVTQLIARITAAIASGDAAELLAVAIALAAIGSGSTPPVAPATGRKGFWK